MQNYKKSKNKEIYDVIIIGGGHAQHQIFKVN